MTDVAARMTMAVMRSPLAPGLWLAFGKWRGAARPVSDLATGTGDTPVAAEARCVGEMVENLSIGRAAHPSAVFVPGAAGRLGTLDARLIGPGDPACLGSEGCAAHPDPAQARLSAVCERIERAALALWLQGRLGARHWPVPGAALHRYRQGEAGRRTRAWRLDLVPGVSVAMVVTDDGADGAIALGSAAAAVAEDSLDAALREAMQAEIIYLVPPDHPDRADALRTARALRARMAALDAAPPGPDSPDGPATSAAVEAQLTASGIPFGIADLTVADIGIPVMRCICPDWPLARRAWAWAMTED
ncbi:MAG: YcaO-like family protein [Gemmobacter sp.]